MNKLGIWTLQADGAAEAVNPVSKVDLEDRLEGMLVQCPDMLEPGIRLVGRQTPTEAGPSDLLGVDTGGQLVVFELKRGASTREAVTQCIDYASALYAMDPEEELPTHIAEHSGKLEIEKIDDFKAWYERDADENGHENELSNLLPPRLVLVGLGVDKRAERMAQFLQARGVDISVLTFYGFKRGGEMLLAREVEVDHASLSSRGQQLTPEKRTRREFWTEFLIAFEQEHEDWEVRRISAGERNLTNLYLAFDACGKAEMHYSFDCAQQKGTKVGVTKVNFWVGLADSTVEEAERNFLALHAQKDEIESHFDERVIWDSKKGRKRRGISIRHPDENLVIGDRERWPEVRDWAIQRLGTLRAAIQPHLSDLAADSG